MASGTRGYSSYRGRGRRGKVLLAVFLILVILASVGFIVAREHMTYDADGNLHFLSPWAPEETDPVEPEPDGDVTIEEPEESKALRAFAVREQPLTQAVWAEASAAFQSQQNAEPDSYAVSVTLKGTGGTVYFDSATAMVGTVALGEDTAQALSLINGAGYDTIARISCFHDSKAANAGVETMGLKNTGGFIFYDGQNSQWLDPGKEAARTYLMEIIRETATLGFDEILLTDVSYPTEGKLDKIDYTCDLPGIMAENGRQDILAQFLRDVRAALPEGVRLSLELDADTIRTGENTAAGQKLDTLAGLVDRIYAKTGEADVPELEQAVAAASRTCGFVPELTELPTGKTENWLLLPE